MTASTSVTVFDLDGTAERHHAIEALLALFAVCPVNVTTSNFRSFFDNLRDDLACLAEAQMKSTSRQRPLAT